MGSAPFFIVGSGRSGSTLLRAILASHSRLCIPPETWYMRPLLRQLSSDKVLNADEQDRAARIMTAHYRWPDMGIETSVFRQRIARLENPFLRDVVELVYCMHLERENKQRWGDKTPGYIEIIPQLTDMFPGARFIHLLRDGRDVARSYQALRWNGPWLHDNMVEWMETMEYDIRWSRSDATAQIFRLRYEDLVLATERTVRDVCAFLGEAFEPQMLAWQDNVDRLVPAREAHIHRKLARRPDPADVYRWKREMSGGDEFVCEAFMGRHLARCGYERKLAGALWMPAFALTRWYCRTVSPISKLGAKALRGLQNRLLRRSEQKRQPVPRG